MKSVFVLIYSKSSPYEITQKESKIFGIYSTHQKAKEAFQKFAKNPKHLELSGEFDIKEFPLDQDIEEIKTKSIWSKMKPITKIWQKNLPFRKKN